MKARTNLIVTALVVAAMCISVSIAGCNNLTNQTSSPSSSASATLSSSVAPTPSPTTSSSPSLTPADIAGAGNGQPNFEGVNPITTDISQLYLAELEKNPNVMNPMLSLLRTGQSTDGGEYAVYAGGWIMYQSVANNGLPAFYVYEVWTSTPSDALALARQQVANFLSQGFVTNPYVTQPTNGQEWNGAGQLNTNTFGYSVSVIYYPADCHVTIMWATGGGTMRETPQWDPVDPTGKWWEYPPWRLPNPWA